MKTPVNDGILQSDLDCAGFDLLNFPGGSGLPGGGTTGQLLQKQSSTDGDADWATVSGGAVPTQHIFYPEDYGAIGDGTTDDTTALQAAITAAVAVNGTVKLSPVTYKITTALSVTGAITIEGSGMLPLYGTIVVTGIESCNLPVISPYLKGSVILQTTAATNGINVSVTGLAVHLRDFGIRFADAIKFTNTGHGIFVEGAANGIYKDQGLFSAIWSNIGVYGHDGNHYAYHFTNPAYLTMEHLTGWGGGGIRIETNQIAIYYGNSCFVNPYFSVCAGGTAHGYYLKATAGPRPIFLTFLRPQVNTINASDVGVIPPATSAQNTFKIDAGSNPTLNIFAPDFETNVSSVTSGLYGTNGVNITGGVVDSNNDKTSWWGGPMQVGLDLTVNGSVYVGTDARLVAVSGGVKLEARNTGTGVWVEAARWTNP